MMILGLAYSVSHVRWFAIVVFDRQLMLVFLIGDLFTCYIVFIVRR